MSPFIFSCTLQICGFFPLNLVIIVVLSFESDNSNILRHFKILVLLFLAQNVFFLCLIVFGGLLVIVVKITCILAPASLRQWRYFQAGPLNSKFKSEAGHTKWYNPLGPDIFMIHAFFKDVILGSQLISFPIVYESGL